MPLVDNINVLDVTNAMTARSKNLRRYRVGDDQDFIDYIETVESATYEYPRATEQAAKNAIELIKNQTTAENQTVNASMVEDVRNVGSYKVIYTSTFTTTTEAAIAPAPTVGGITWSRNSETVSSWPQSITMTSANSADRIWYRIDAINSSGATVPGEFINGGSNNVTVSLNTSTLKEGRDGHHKQVVIVAEVRRTQLTGQTYIGAQSSRKFTQNAPSISSISWNITDNLSVTTWPVSINATTTTAGANVFRRIIEYDNKFDPVYGNFVSGGSFSANTSKIAGGAKGLHKIITVEAEARVTLDGIVYSGQRSQRTVFQSVPSISSISWNITDNHNVTSWPVSITATTNTSGASVYHRITAYNAQQQGVVGNFVSGGNISANTNILSAGANGFHKHIYVEAEARITLDGVVYIGARSGRNVRQLVPSVSSISWSISDNFTVTSWPVSITATTSTTNASVFHRITAFNSFGQGIVGSFTSGGNISANTNILSAGANGFHKRIYVEAEARITLDGIVYTGARSGRNVRQLAPSINLNATPGGNSFDPSNFGQNMYDFPMTVAISHSVNATIELSIQQQDWASGQIVRTNSPIIVAVGGGQTHSITFTHGQPPTYYNNQSNTYWYVRLIIAATYNYEGIDYTQIIQPFYYAYRRFTS